MLKLSCLIVVLCLVVARRVDSQLTCGCDSALNCTYVGWGRACMTSQDCARHPSAECVGYMCCTKLRCPDAAKTAYRTCTPSEHSECQYMVNRPATCETMTELATLSLGVCCA